MPLARSYRAVCDQQRRQVRGAGLSVVNLEEEEVVVTRNLEEEVMVLDDSDDEVQEIQDEMEEVEIVSLGSPVRRVGRRGERGSLQSSRSPRRRESVLSNRSPSPPVMELDQVGENSLI